MKLSCRRLRLRSVKPISQAKLHRPKHQSQEQAPTQHLSVKRAKVSLCQGETDPTEDKGTLLEGQHGNIVTATDPSLQWRESSAYWSCLRYVWSLWLGDRCEGAAAWISVLCYPPICRRQLSLAEQSPPSTPAWRILFAPPCITEAQKSGQTQGLSVTGFWAGPFSPLSCEPDQHLPLTKDQIKTPSWLLADSISGIQRPTCLTNRASALAMSRKNQ